VRLGWNSVEAVDLFHVLYFSGSMCVGVTVWFGWVVWYLYAG